MSLWVLPEAMEMALSGELFKEPLMISDSAREDALACLAKWDYDTLALQEASGGHALLLVGEALFEWHKLHEPCNVDRKVLHRFLRALEACYGDHEYHNSMHGADVALGVHRFIVNFDLTARLTKLELLAALVGALVHDFNHPGTTNQHEVKARTERALMHTDAILERHHLHSTFRLLATPGFDLFGEMPADDEETCRKLIVDMVLATDLKRHGDITSTLRTLAAQHGATAVGANFTSPSSPFHSEELVKMPQLLAVAIKFADLSHCFKPFHIHEHWVKRITKEFWALGDLERKLDIALSPLCNRDKDANVRQSQIDFFKFILPFYSVVADLIDPTMLPLQRVEANLQAWVQAAAVE